MVKFNFEENVNFNYLIIFTYIFWASLMIYYFLNSEIIKAGELDGLINYGKDSILYLDKANLIANFQFDSIPITKLSYIILLSIPIIFNFNLSVIVIFQFFTTICSSYCLYKIGSKLSSKTVGIISMFLFLTYLPIQLRNFYLLTEILFINISIILIYFVLFKRNHNLIFIFLLIFFLFLRPQSILFLSSLIISFQIYNYSKKKENYIKKINPFLILIIILFLIFFLNLITKDYDLINSLSRGIIWGYSFDTNSICSENCVNGLISSDSYEKNLFGLIKFFFDNFFILMKIFFLKIIIFLTGWRPYYSNIHNFYILSVHLIFIFTYVLSLIKIKKYSFYDYFVLTYLIILSISVGLTFADWSGRFVMYIIPFTIIISSQSLAPIIRFFLNR